MTYVSWGALYEGVTDQLYFNVLLPRLMEDIIVGNAARNYTVPTFPAVQLKRGSSESIAQQICDYKDAFQIIFIHADTGGRNLELGLAARGENVCELAHQRCAWPLERCVIVTPRHETEAWILADPAAVCSSLGYSGSHASIGLPTNAREAERLVDPKAVLSQAANQIRGRRKRQSAEQLLPAIAQRQSLSVLRSAASFRLFEASLVNALRSIGCLNA